jgi:hypothetical protein
MEAMRPGSSVEDEGHGFTIRANEIKGHMTSPTSSANTSSPTPRHGGG